jgi:membrane fusion protein (multidrug efflux system)
VTVFFLVRTGKPAAPEEQEEVVATEVAVHVGKIVRATLHSYVVAYGAVEPEPACKGRPPASARIFTPVAGIIAEANCVEGQRVAKGETLFRMDSRVADVLVEKAKQAVAFAEKDYDRQKKLRETEATSVKLLQSAEQELNSARNELLSVQTQLALLTVKAPLAGTVVEVHAKPGDVVDTTTVLAEVADLDRLVVSANVPSAELPLLKLGQSVEFSAAVATAEAGAKTPRVLTGALTFIGSEVDGKTDTVLVRVSPRDKAGLRPGQFVKLRIVCEEHPGCLAVPDDSVVTDTDGKTVIALVEGDKAIQKPVKTGLKEGGLVEVEGEGLKEGLAIVTTDAYGLPKETKIRVVGQ